MTVQEVHAEIDEFLGKTGIKELSCCSTCTLATCCYEPVYVGKDEVQWMLDSLTPEQLEYVTEMTREWSVKAVGTGMLPEKRVSAYTWITHKIPCPFLKDKKCMTYERRPMSCRMWFARSNPENCDMPGRLHQQHADFLGSRHIGGEYFAAQYDGGTLHMDHLGVILTELLLGIKIPTGAKLTMENFNEKMKDPESL